MLCGARLQAREEKERKKRELEEEQSPVTYLSDADFDGSGALKEQLKQQRHGPKKQLKIA